MRNSTGEFLMRYGGSFTVTRIILQNGFLRNARCPSIVLHRDSETRWRIARYDTEGTLRGICEYSIANSNIAMSPRSLYPSVTQLAIVICNYFDTKTKVDHSVVSRDSRERVLFNKFQQA